MSSENAAPAAQAPSENDRLMSGLAYIIYVLLPILMLFVLEESKKRAFQRFHAVQALAVAVVSFAYYVVLQWILGGIVRALFYGGLRAFTLGLLCMSIVDLVTWLPIVAVNLFLAYQAYTGKLYEVPVLTPFLRQQKWL